MAFVVMYPWPLFVLLLVASEAARPPIEVVVAHYNEDLAWIDRHSSPEVAFTIYTKGGAPTDKAAALLPNVGRESHTYLHHIVRRYDRLAPWTVFTQGTRPAWGYQNGDPASGHLTDNITFTDYLDAFRQGRDAFFAVSAATHIPRGIQSTRLGILTNKLRSVSNGRCPTGGADGWSTWWFDANHPHCRAGLRMLDFYYRHVLQDKVAVREPVTLGFAQGARFGLSRARVRSRPREYYEALLKEVSRHVDAVEGYFMEAMWYDIFHPERLQVETQICEYPSLPVGVGMPLNQMYLDTVQRFDSEDMVVDLISPRSLADAYQPDEPAEPTPSPSWSDEVSSTTTTTTTTATPLLLLSSLEPELASIVWFEQILDIEGVMPWGVIGAGAFLLLVVCCCIRCCRRRRRRKRLGKKADANKDEDDPPLFPGRQELSPIDAGQYDSGPVLDSFLPATDLAEQHAQELEDRPSDSGSSIASGSESQETSENVGSQRCGLASAPFYGGAYATPGAQELRRLGSPQENLDDFDSRPVGELLIPEEASMQISVVRPWLQKVYARYNPNKVDRVDDLLLEFKGREAELVKAVSHKYRLDPSHFERHFARSRTSASSCGACVCGHPGSSGRGFSFQPGPGVLPEPAQETHQKFH